MSDHCKNQKKHLNLSDEFMDHVSTNFTENSAHQISVFLRLITKFHSQFALCHGNARRMISKNDLQTTGEWKFKEWCFYHLPEYFTRPPSLMHEWFMRFLDHMRTARGTKLNIIGPRGGAKSTIGTLAFPLREALEGREKYIWIVSDTIPQACSHLENIYHAIRDNSMFMSKYSFLSKDIRRAIKYRTGVLELRNGVRLEAFSMGQKIRGRRHRENRPTLIICDDLQNDFHMRSKLLRKNTREWFFGSLIKAGTKQTNIINLATALHRDALAMELCKTPGWKSRIFRSILNYPENMELWQQWENIYADTELTDSKLHAKNFYIKHKSEMDHGARVLWPEEEDLYTLMCLRAEGGHVAFNREKQNSPIDPEQCEWTEEYFEGENFWYDSIPPKEIIAKVMALDPSKGKHANRGDYSAYVMLSVSRQGDFYVDAALMRCSAEQLVSEGVTLYQSFHPDAFGVEGNQFQELLAEMFSREFRQRGMLFPQPWLIHNHVSKEVRIRRLGQYLASKKIHFHAGSPGAKLVVEQLRQFPIGDHDDGADALEMAIRLLHEKLGMEHFNDGLGNRLHI
ncbi:MAG: hypothetical protein Q4C96_00240 [Planctomycetia bacterium]|nr:hypothetical protein [Planctomycetia bacterium]